jgi:hypothetical protein
VIADPLRQPIIRLASLGGRVTDNAGAKWIAVLASLSRVETGRLASVGGLVGEGGAVQPLNFG